MAEYTYADVIIDPEDPRVEIGKEYYFGDCPLNLIIDAENDYQDALGCLEYKDSSNRPFYCAGFKFPSYPCIIRKKEPKKRYVPFDLSKEEDRARLRGAWVRDKGSGREYAVTGIFLDETPPYVEFNDNGFEPDYLLENYEFVDGSPCGRFAEEE